MCGGDPNWLYKIISIARKKIILRALPTHVQFAVKCPLNPTIDLAFSILETLVAGWNCLYHAGCWLACHLNFSFV